MQIALPPAQIATSPRYPPPAFSHPSSPSTSPPASEPHQLQRLFRLLRRMAGREETLTFGGVQSLLNRHQSGPGAGPGDSHSPNLPDSVLLEIFALLTPEELGTVSRVCWQWNRVASDELLWRFLLHRDQKTWDNLSHEANPDLFEATGADLGSKERYLRCCPRFRASQRTLSPEPNLANLTRFLPALLRRAWPLRRPPAPRLAMLGPGLDSGCSGLSRKIIADPSGLFTVGKAFPGSNGMGSGFTCTLHPQRVPPASQAPEEAGAGAEAEAEVEFGISFLYSAPRAEREAGAARGQAGSRLFERRPADAEGRREVQLSHSFKELCNSLHGLIFVTDAAAPPSCEREAEAREELAALAEHCWHTRVGRPPMPLLVLSMVAGPEQEARRSHTCLDVVRWLDLNAIRLPWRVYSGSVDSAKGIADGLRWLNSILNDGAQ